MNRFLTTWSPSTSFSSERRRHAFLFFDEGSEDRKCTDDQDGTHTKVPGHPVTTALFVIVCWLVVINTVYKYPENTLIGLAILLAGIPAFYFWRARQK